MVEDRLTVGPWNDSGKKKEKSNSVYVEKKINGKRSMNKQV